MQSSQAQCGAPSCSLFNLLLDLGLAGLLTSENSFASSSEEDKGGRVVSRAVWNVRSVVMVAAGPGLSLSSSSLLLVPLTPTMDSDLSQSVAGASCHVSKKVFPGLLWELKLA